jgi:hypothetical protein
MAQFFSPSIEIGHEKQRFSARKENIRFNTNKHPDIRDNPDSRKNEEQNFKGMT